MKEINSRILDLLKENGKTQKEMAIATGIKPGTINSWLTKDVSPSIEFASKIASYFGISIDYLVTGEQGEEPQRDPGKRKMEQIYDVLQPALQSRLITYGEGLVAAQEELRGD